MASFTLKTKIFRSINVLKFENFIKWGAVEPDAN